MSLSLSISNFPFFSFFSFFHFSFLIFLFFFLLFRARYFGFGYLLDWTENENRQFEENLSLPFSVAMRPSKLSTKPLDDKSFMGEFMKHIQQGKEPKGVANIPIPGQQQPQQQQQLPTTTFKPTKAPREPKKPRKKKEKSISISPPKCTTIGLQIQIHDPITEPATETPLETSFESDIATYPFSQIDVGSTGPIMMTPTKNPISNSMVEMSPSVAAPSQHHHHHHTTTYFNLDSSRADEYIIYDPDPVTYHGQQMNMMPNECMSLPDQINSIQQPPPPPPPPLPPMQPVEASTMHHLSNATAPHHPYGIHLLNYSDQNKSSTALISHFNVNNASTVCDQVHNNWRAVNEIMLNK